MGELAIAAMHRICKKAGAERVSESAAKEMGRVLEEIGVKIGKGSYTRRNICYHFTIIHLGFICIVRLSSRLFGLLLVFDFSPDIDSVNIFVFLNFWVHVIIDLE